MTNLLDSLVLNKRTRRQAELFLNKPGHALLISGLTGSGKYSLALLMASSVLGLKTERELSAYPYFIHLSKPPDKQEIPIEAVRDVIRSLQLKTPGSKQVRRVIVVEDAHNMSIEAQNSLLKALEEPASDSVFILTAPSEHHILPTVASRVQKIHVYSVSLAGVKNHYGSEYSDNEVESAWRLSAGAFGLLEALLHDSQEHPLKKAVEQVKIFLTKDTYSRLIMAGSLSANRLDLSLFLEAASRVLNALHHGLRTENQSKQLKVIVIDRKLVNDLQKKLQANANPRLLALELALKLRM